MSSLGNASYKDILDKFKDFSEYKDKLSNINEIQIEIKVWNKLKSKNTSEAYKQYLKEYPNGIYINEAKKLCIIAEDNEAWQKAQKKNTSKSYKEYIDKYPNGQYIKEANVKYQECLDNEAWQKAQKENTQKAYEEYLKEFKDGIHKNEAQDKINYFIADEEAWQKAKNEDSVKSYKKYIEKFSDGKYNQLAHLMVEKKQFFKNEEFWAASTGLTYIIGGIIVFFMGLIATWQDFSDWWIIFRAPLAIIAGFISGALWPLGIIGSIIHLFDSDSSPKDITFSIVFLISFAILYFLMMFISYFWVSSDINKKINTEEKRLAKLKG